MIDGLESEKGKAFIFISKSNFISDGL